jgi:hypothetical protein
VGFAVPITIVEVSIRLRTTAMTATATATGSSGGVLACLMRLCPSGRTWTAHPPGRPLDAIVSIGANVQRSHVVRGPGREPAATSSVPAVQASPSSAPAAPAQFQPRSSPVPARFQLVPGGSSPVPTRSSPVPEMFQLVPAQLNIILYYIIAQDKLWDFESGLALTAPPCAPSPLPHPSPLQLVPATFQLVPAMAQPCSSHVPTSCSHVPAMFQLVPAMFQPCSN